MLDELERRLEGGGFLHGARLTETDIRLFVTLVRFDAAYHGLGTVANVGVGQETVEPRTGRYTLSARAPSTR